MKSYSTPEKMRARRETIIEPYRERLYEFLPAEKQYWTMCATHDDGVGGLLADSELDQMMKAGLIVPDQFHGVDIESSIIGPAAAAVPSAHWHHGRLLDEMRAAERGGWFNPGIVHHDLLMMPKAGATEVARCLQFLSDQEDVLFVCNMIIKSPYGCEVCTSEEYLEELESKAQFRDARRRGWRYDGENEKKKCWFYTYEGNGGKTTLGTMLFVK